MPYVAKDRRSVILTTRFPETVGELTYLITSDLNTYLRCRKQLRYQDLAECLGALEGAKLDLIERLIKPYEQKALERNGDVWSEEVLDKCQ
jgi:hypothetical protein